MYEDNNKKPEAEQQTLKAWHQPQCKKLSADNTEGKSWTRPTESTGPFSSYGPS